jgi:hypothetical protein
MCINAIENLLDAPTNKKKLINIDIIVIRTSKTGLLGMSKPCSHCLLLMQTLPNKKGYIIKNIYYSNANGDIIKTSIDKLLLEDLHISSYYRNHKFKLNI